jgi:hypothetical protein
MVTLILNDKDFGPWEQIFYGEFDGGRRKRVLVKVILDMTGLKPVITATRDKIHPVRFV